MKIYAATLKGSEHYENEDRIIVGKTILSMGSFEAEMDSGLLAIADGVGGQNAGAVASGFIASEISQLNEVNIEALKAINEALIEKSNSDISLNGMATTLSALFVSDKKIVYHVGNSRIYHLKSGKYLRQLTDDDTSVNFLVSTGRLSIGEAENYEHKNQITACFGSGDSSLLRIKTADASNYDNAVFIFTTDGIHDYVSLDDLESVFSENTGYADICKKVITLAEKSGSMDDKSIMIGVM